MQRVEPRLRTAIIALLTLAAELGMAGFHRVAGLTDWLGDRKNDSKQVMDKTSTLENPDAGGNAASPAVASLVRESERVRLRRHIPENRDAFQRWYADPEIAYLIRHDLRPLNDRQSRGYFDTIILPLSAAGRCFAIHDAATDQLIGTTALTEIDDDDSNAMLLRIVIGEKAFWDRGLGTEATRLVAEEAFESLNLDEVRLDVFAHNPRAISVYERVGFVRTGEHTEWVGPNRPRLHVFEMSLRRPPAAEATAATPDPDDDHGLEPPAGSPGEPEITDRI